MSGWHDWFTEIAGEIGDAATPSWARWAYKKAKKQISKEYREELEAIKSEKQALLKSLNNSNELCDVLRDRIHQLEMENEELKSYISDRKDD